MIGRHMCQSSVLLTGVVYEEDANDQYVHV